jgi:hypothetical protein
MQHIIAIGYGRKQRKKGIFTIYAGLKVTPKTLNWRIFPRTQ